MANYKRGSCRYLGKNRRNSETFYRKRHGLKPIKVPSWPKRPMTLAEIQAHFLWRKQQNFWPDQFWMMGNWPRSWDILFHTRPHRSRTKAMAKKVMAGKIDAENAAWPVAKKPHQYYW